MALSVGGMQSPEPCEVVFQLVNNMALCLHVAIGTGFDNTVSHSEAIGAGERILWSEICMLKKCGSVELGMLWDCSSSCFLEP